MLSFVSSVCALAVPVVLLLALAEHLASPASLRQALISQAVLPPGLTWPAAYGVIGVEAALTLAVGAGLASASRGDAPLRLGLAASALLFATYAAYTFYLLLRRQGAPCGCSRHDMEVNGWVVLRALGCLAFAGLALRWSDHVLPVSGSGARSAIALSAAATFAIVLWHLPTALQDPVQQVIQQGRSRVRALGREELTA